MVTAFEADQMSTAVAITVVMDGGWSADPSGKAGVSHLLERAWWNSEVSSGVRVVDQMVNGYGCEVDSFVGHDVLRFTAVCPVTAVDAAMKVMGRLFQDPLAGIDEAVLEEEKKRVRSDAALRASLSLFSAREMVGPLFAQIYPQGHPYHREFLGDLDSLTMSDVAAFSKDRLLPVHATVTIGGGYDDALREYGLSLVASNFPLHTMHPDLKPEHMQRYAKGEYDEPDEEDPSHWWMFPADPDEPRKSLGFAKDRIPRIKGIDDTPAEPPELESFAVYEGGVDRPTVLVGWSLPPSWKQADGDYQVLARLITMMVAQNLDEPYIEQFPGCYIIPGLHATTLTCAAILKEGQESAGERIARRIVDQLTYVTDMGNRTGVDVAVGRSQVDVLAGLLWNFDRLGSIWNSRGYWLSSGVHFANERMAVTDVISGTPGARPERLIELTETLITRSRSRGVLLVPVDSGEIAIRNKPENPRNRDQAAVQGTYWSRLATRPAALPVSPERLSDARIQSTWSAVPDDQIQVTRLSGGLSVVVVSQPELPVAHYRLIVRNGRVNDQSENQLHHYGREFVRPARAVRTEPSGFGAQFVAWRDDVHHQASLRASPTNMEQALWVLRELAGGWRVTTASKSEWLRNQKKTFVGSWYDPAWHVRDLSRQHLFGDHPIGDAPEWGDMEAWSALSTTDFRDMMRAKWREDNATILVVGPVDAQKVVSRVRAHFNSWATPQPESDRWGPSTLDLAPRPESTMVHVLHRDGDHADVRLQCRVDAAPELRKAVEHHVRSRVGDKWLSLVSASRAWPGGTSVLEVDGRILTSDVGPAIAMLGAALREDVQGLTEEQARGSVWRGAMDTTMSLSSYQLTAARVVETLGEGRDVTDAAAIRERIADVDAAALKPLIERCVATSFVSIVGDTPSVSASLQGAGVGFEVTDWDARGKALHEAADPKGYAKEQKKRSRER
jgi:predicted Zn-dependent peptidase